MRADAEMKVILRWEEPRGQENGGSRAGEGGGSCWDDVVEALKHEAPTWAVVYEGRRSTAHSIRGLINNARIACFRPVGTFESVSRQKVRGDNSVIVVYARYVGQEGDEES